MHNVDLIDIKVAPITGEQNKRKVLVAGQPCAIASQQYGSWFIEALNEQWCGHAQTLRQIRHVVALNVKEFAL